MLIYIQSSDQMASGYNFRYEKHQMTDVLTGTWVICSFFISFTVRSRKAALRAQETEIFLFHLKQWAPNHQNCIYFNLLDSDVSCIQSSQLVIDFYIFSAAELPVD